MRLGKIIYIVVKYGISTCVFQKNILPILANECNIQVFIKSPQYKIKKKCLKTQQKKFFFSFCFVFIFVAVIVIVAVVNVYLGYNRLLLSSDPLITTKSKNYAKNIYNIPQMALDLLMLPKISDEEEINEDIDDDN